jgi:hypothetical protein
MTPAWPGIVASEFAVDAASGLAMCHGPSFCGGRGRARAVGA